MFDYLSEISCEIIYIRVFVNIVGFLYLIWYDMKKLFLSDEILEVFIKEI